MLGGDWPVNGTLYFFLQKWCLNNVFEWKIVEHGKSQANRAHWIATKFWLVAPHKLGRCRTQKGSILIFWQDYPYIFNKTNLFSVAHRMGLMYFRAVSCGGGSGGGCSRVLRFRQKKSRFRWADEATKRWWTNRTGTHRRIINYKLYVRDRIQHMSTHIYLIKGTHKFFNLMESICTIYGGMGR